MTDATIWWVRHGPTHARGMVGWSDPPADLSDADRIAGLRADLPEDVPVVSSDLLRAAATAEAIAGARPRLAPDPRLREMSFGAWEMRAHDEIAAEDPDAIAAFWDRPAEVRPPGGESWPEMAARVEAAAADLRGRHERLIVVAHFGVILSQAARVGGWDHARTFAQRIEPLSVTELRYGDRPGIRRVNHLP